MGVSYSRFTTVSKIPVCPSPADKGRSGRTETSLPYCLSRNELSAGLAGCPQLRCTHVRFVNVTADEIEMPMRVRASPKEPGIQDVMCLCKSIFVLNTIKI